MVYYLGGGNSNIFLFSSLLGEDEPNFDEYFSNGLKPPTSLNWMMIPNLYMENDCLKGTLNHLGVVF